MKFFLKNDGELVVTFESFEKWQQMTFLNYLRFEDETSEDFQILQELKAQIKLNIIRSERGGTV